MNLCQSYPWLKDIGSQDVQDGRAPVQHCAFVLPSTRDVVCCLDGDAIARGEAKVLAIRDPLDEGWVKSRAITSALASSVGVGEGKEGQQDSKYEHGAQSKRETS